MVAKKKKETDDDVLNVVEATQILAMGSVVKGDGEFQLRAIMREYSKIFHTPLHVVEALPLEHVLRHFYEERYYHMEEEERAEACAKLAASKEDVTLEKRAEDANDAQASLWAMEEAAKAKSAPKKLVDVKPREKEFNVKDDRNAAQLVDPKMKVNDDKGDIEMKFLDDEAFAKEMKAIEDEG